MSISLAAAADQGDGNSGLGISSNPSSTNLYVGTGALGRAFGLKDNSGLRLGAQWIGDVNWLMTRSLNRRKWTGDSLFQLGLTLDTEKIGGWKGGMFGVDFLQFNGGPTNVDAGAAPGYNGLIGPRPWDRSELYQYWYRQKWMDGKLILRIGQVVPIYDFNNVIKPVYQPGQSSSIPSVSGLILTSIFVNPSMLGVLPGYYNSAFGLTATYAPNKNLYVSYGLYDGNLARGKQTGLRGPQFNGYYFTILETGWIWELGKEKKPGNFAIGVWRQTGKLYTPDGRHWQKGAQGAYLFGAQRLWFRNPGKDNSGVSGFYQFGINNSTTLPFHKFAGLGLTAFGLIPERPNDSFGTGAAFTWLNRHVFKRRTELILQSYYQANLFNSVYLQPVISYIPRPGAASKLKNTWASTVRLITLF